MAKPGTPQQISRQAKPSKAPDKEQEADDTRAADDAPRTPAAPAGVDTSAADTTGHDTDTTLVDEATRAASQGFGDGAGATEADPTRDGHDTIIDDDASAPTGPDAIPGARGEIPTDTAGLEDYARDQIDAALFGQGDALLADTGFASGHDLDQIDLGHAGSSPGRIADQGIGGVASGMTDADEQNELNRFLTRKAETVEEVSPYIDQTPTSEWAEELEYDESHNAYFSDPETKLQVAQQMEDYDARQAEAELIEAKVQEAEFKKKEGLEQPDEEDFDPDSVGGRIARALRESMAPRSGGGDGHTDPADDATPIEKGGAITDTQDTLLGGTTRGTAETGGNHGVPNRDAGTIDPTDETDFGSGAGREIDPLTDDGPALDFDAGNRIDDDTDDTDLGIGGLMTLHPTLLPEAELFSGSLEFDRTHAVAVDDEPDLDDDLDD